MCVCESVSLIMYGFMWLCVRVFVCLFEMSDASKNMTKATQQFMSAPSTWSLKNFNITSAGSAWYIFCDREINKKISEDERAVYQVQILEESPHFMRFFLFRKLSADSTIMGMEVSTQRCMKSSLNRKRNIKVLRKGVPKKRQFIDRLFFVSVLIYIHNSH